MKFSFPKDYWMWWREGAAVVPHRPATNHSTTAVSPGSRKKSALPDWVWEVLPVLVLLILHLGLGFCTDYLKRKQLPEEIRYTPR